MVENESASAPPPPDGNTEGASSSPGRGGRGYGRGRGNSRGRGYKNKGNGGNYTAKVPSTAFKGNTDGMKGNVFQCHGKNTDKQHFMKTVGILEEHINKTFSYPQDVASMCKPFKIIVLLQPANLTKEENEQDMGKKFDLGNTHEELHEASGSTGKQHTGNIRNRLGPV
jgi:hypothetical protein